MDRHKLSTLEFEEQVLETLTSFLEDTFDSDAEISFVRSKSLPSYAEYEPDGLIEIRTPTKTLMLCVEVKKNVYPRDIRDAVWKLKDYMHHQAPHPEMVGMIAADTLSPGAKQDLKGHNIASYELGGSLFLKHEQWFINVEKPTKRSKKKAHGVDLFTDARESVIHALLTHSHEWLSGTELSNLAETSQYTCSLVLKELTRREWVDSTGGGPSSRKMLIKPEKLLDAWAEHWPDRKDTQTKWYTFVDNPKQLLDRLAEQIERQGVDYPWAFTGPSAANAIAPLLTSTSAAEIIVPKGYSERMADLLALKPVTKGANVTIIERETTSLLYRHKHPNHPAFFASPYILYLDLLNGRGRNKELAAHLRKQLELLWERN